MLNRRRIIVGLGVTLLIMVCCTGICVWEGGYYLPNKPCRPLNYPGGEVVVDDFFYKAEEPLDQILIFYDQHLNAQSTPAVDFGTWDKEILYSDIYLFSCHNPDINGSTSETGCIYILDDKEFDSRIVITRLHRGDIIVPCARQKRDIQSLYK